MDEKSVVYLTIYSGDLLPKYYIGSTYYEKYSNNYHGSVCSKKWKDIYDNEIKYNPHLFKTEIIEICDTRVEALERELYHQKLNNVVESTEYFNESYAIPNGFFGNRNIASLNATNNTNVRGRIWVNDGKRSKMVNPNKIPDGFVLGRCKQDKNNMSNALIGKQSKWRWVTNINSNESKRISKNDPLPNGFREGRTNKISKIMVKARKSYKWYHNPKTDEAKRFYENDIIPNDWIRGRGNSFAEKVKKSINELSNNN